MGKIEAGEKLKNSIKVLEVDQSSSAEQLKKQIDQIAESVKPVNLIKNMVNGVITSSKLIGNVLGLTTGLITGYLSRKIFVGSSRNLMRKLIGITIQVGVTKFVALHQEKIESAFLVFLKNIRSKSIYRKW